MPQEMAGYYGDIAVGGDGNGLDEDEPAEETEGIDVQPAAALANGDAPSDDPDAAPAEAEPVSQVE